jgi:acetolactate synthase-1/2/3 large subunit
MARLGEHLPRLLLDRGVEIAFGIPGVHTVEFYRGLPGLALRHVAARHEQGAGFMADGYARAGGRPAACFVITGPGVTNIATAMGQALNDSIPMLVISSDNPRAEAGRGLGSLHELRDQGALVAGVARWSRTVTAAEALPEALDAAMAQFAAARPGPVHIQIPIDVLGAECGALPAPPAPPPPPPGPSAAAAAELIMRLSSAQRPVLILGGGAVGLGAATATALAERLAAPTLLTSNARGLLPPLHPLLAGGRLHSAPVRRLIAEAHAVLALGTEFSSTDWDFYGGGPVAFAPDALIRVDIDPDQLGRNAAPALGVAADARRTVETLLEVLPPRRAAPPDLAALREAAAHEAHARFRRHQPLFEEIWDTAPDAIVVGDSTEPAYQGLLGAQPPGPRRWWTSATGFGTLGYALPAAIGARLAQPRRPVIALIGDGGALYTIAEIAAAAEAGVHLIVMVWNNSGYGEIRDYMKDKGIRPCAVDLSPVDFQAVARGFGAAYQRVHRLHDLSDALKKATARAGVTLLELREEFWFQT